MRRLNTDELLERFHRDASDILYADHKDTTIKIDQLFEFLYSQDISSRILKRIEEEHPDILLFLSDVDVSRPSNITTKEVKSHLKDRELQGVFGYFAMKKLFHSETRRYNSYYIDMGWTWYGAVGGYTEYHEGFNTYFFKPFVDIFDWYIYESKTRNENDYFSKDSQEIVLDKLSDIQGKLDRQAVGLEMIFAEFEEQAEFITFLNKRSWIQQFKGRMISLTAGKVITEEQAESLLSQIIEVVNNLPK